jgi:galactokinase
MTGGGFGGAIVVLARDADADAIGADVVEGYRRRFPGRTAQVHRCRASDGAGELPVGQA